MMDYHKIALVAEVKLVYQTKVKPSERIKISNSKDAYELLKVIWDNETLELREEFKVILLNNAHKALGYYNLSAGGVAGTVADPKLIFCLALTANAVSIILAHNHPSGNLQPSASDINLTKKVKEAGKLLEITVMDHLIYTTEAYYSFADEGII